MRTRIHHPVHIEWRGTVRENLFVTSPRDLSGPYLDYALASAVRCEVIELRFTAALTLDEVQVGAEGESTRHWSPTRDQELAKRLVAEHLGRAPEVVSIADLREVVSSKLGEQITLCKLTQGSA